MCLSCDSKDTLREQVAARLHGLSTMDSDGQAQAIRKAIRDAIITRAADAADEHERGCAGWMLIQHMYPDVTEAEWVTSGGDVPSCEGETLRGVDHTMCRGKCDNEYSCCGYCADCDTHHYEGEEGNAGGDYYCPHCERCSDCGHDCSNY